MRSWADSSFLVRLFTREAGTEESVALYRRLGRPRLLFSPLHELEVRNAFRLKAFLISQGAAATQRQEAVRLREASLSRLDRSLDGGRLWCVDLNWRAGLDAAQRLSLAHTGKTGCRAFDLLHVAFALELECEQFLTCDSRQTLLAKATGLKVSMVPIA